jgi:HD-GYP domain-containing protein (c-di-GMP phosphodiesterase class II)
VSQRVDWEALVQEAITELAAGLTTVGLYGIEHPRAQQSVERLTSQLGALLEGERELTIVLLGDELFVQGRPFTRSSRQAPSLIRRLRRRDLEHVAFRQGLSAEEVRDFLIEMATAEETSVRSRPHIQIGRVELAEQELGGPNRIEGGERRRRLPSLRDRIAVIEEAFGTIMAAGELPVFDLEQVARALLNNLEHDPDPIKQFAPWEGEEHWPAVHAHNVCALTLGMARLCGIGASWSIDLGVAALLHDTGKLMLPAEVQERELELGGDELELMLDHQRLTLELLLASTQPTPLALIVAFEHHLAYNGTGSPRLQRPRRPHPATRLIAVADAFVVLFTSRGRGTAGRETAIAWLNEHNGTLLDPGWTGVLEALLVTC